MNGGLLRAEQNLAPGSLGIEREPILGDSRP